MKVSIRIEAEVDDSADEATLADLTEQARRAVESHYAVERTVHAAAVKRRRQG